jgi:phenylalanyl-tRNA synthetase alpha subunit
MKIIVIDSLVIHGKWKMNGMGLEVGGCGMFIPK